MHDPGTARLIRQAEEAQAMLSQALVQLAETQGKLQACEEIIARTRAIVEELHEGAHLTGYAHENLTVALGPAA